MITEYDALVVRLGLSEQKEFIKNLHRLSAEYPDAKNLLADMQKLQSKASYLKNGLSFEDFRRDLFLYYDMLVFNIVFCVIMMKDMYHEEDDTTEEQQYLYNKYSEDYDKFIHDIQYVLDNVEDFLEEYNSRKPVVISPPPKEIPPPPQLAPIPEDK